MHKENPSSIETKVICRAPVIVHHMVRVLSDDKATAEGVGEAVAVFLRAADGNEKIDLIIDFSTLPMSDNPSYKLSAHGIWAQGFKENKELQKRVRRVAIVAHDSPKVRAEKEFMENENRRFFTRFQDALDWLKSGS
jgi:hypothetical protein